MKLMIKHQLYHGERLNSVAKKESVTLFEKPIGIFDKILLTKIFEKIFLKKNFFFFFLSKNIFIYISN